MLHSWKLGIRDFDLRGGLCQHYSSRLKQQQHLLLFHSSALEIKHFLLASRHEWTTYLPPSAFYTAPELFSICLNACSVYLKELKKELSEVCLLEAWVTHAVLYDTLAFTVVLLYGFPTPCFTIKVLTELSLAYGLLYSVNHSSILTA